MTVHVAALTILCAALQIGNVATLNRRSYRQAGTANVNAAGQIGEEQSTNARCPLDYVYYVQSERGDVVMQCDLKPICGELKHCFYSVKHACTNPFEYLTNVLFTLQQDGKHHQEECCEYAISPTSHVQEYCDAIHVKDRSRSNSNATSTAANHRYRRETNNGEAKIRETTLQLHSVITTNQVVKNIRPVSGGIDITVCTIVCDQSTSTHTQTAPTPPRRGDEAAIAALAAVAGASSADTHSQNGQNCNGNCGERSPESSPNGESGPGVSTFNLPRSLPCFSGDQFVQTLQGQKLMKHLEHGDRVLVALEAGANTIFGYEPIEMFLHRRASYLSEYITLTTESGRDISLSSHHMIPLVECSENFKHTSLTDLVESSSKFAHRATVGQCLVEPTGSQTWVLQKIVKIAKSRKEGLFSPVTSSGTLVVNGVVVSCYSVVESHPFQRAVFRKYFVYRSFFYRVLSFFGYHGKSWEELDLPAEVQAAVVIASTIF